MKIKVSYNPYKGVIKVRPTFGTLVGIGASIATIKFAYELTETFYQVSLRRLEPQIESARHKVAEKEAEIRREVNGETNASDG